MATSPLLPLPLLFPLASPSTISEPYGCGKEGSDENRSMMRGRSFVANRKRPPEERTSREVKPGPHKRARISLPRTPSLLSSNRFVRAVGDPLVEHRRPVFEWETGDEAWKFWDFVPLGCNISMRDKDPAATFEADKRRADEILERLQRKVELEYELHRAYPFLSEKALLPEGQLHSGDLRTSSSSAEEQSEESTSVPMAGWQLDEQLHSTHSTSSPICGSETDEEQHNQLEMSSPKLGPWLVKMQQNGRLISESLVGSRNNSFDFNSDPDPDIFLGSQPSFDQMSYLTPANTLSSWFGDVQGSISRPRSGDMQRMILSSRPSHHQQYLESISETSGLQQNMPVMQQHLLRDSRIPPCRMQECMEGLMPTPGAENGEQYNVKYSKQRLRSKRQQAPWRSSLAPGIQACSVNSTHALGLQHAIQQYPACYDQSLQWFQTW